MIRVTRSRPPVERDDHAPEPGRRYTIPPQSGVAFLITKGQTLAVIDPVGGQVADWYAVNAHDLAEHFSSGRSIDYADTLYLTTGHVLCSNRSTPLMTIVRDDVGRHDCVLTPCSPEMYRKLRNDDGSHPSCFENLRLPMAALGVNADHINSTLNLFMDVRFDPQTGKMSILPPPSKPGDRVELLAQTDLIVGLTACSSEVTNNGTLGPIEFEVR